MTEIDRAAPEPTAVLVDRAGSAVARAAVSMMGGTYGRRVVVVAGKGNNGADGRVAAARLARRGVGVRVVDAIDAPSSLPACDLVIDAAYGTGFRGTYDAPGTGGAPVLAVDIPSGVDGATGRACPNATRADRTLTFAALKPGLLLGDGAALAGVVDVVDIGLDTSRATIGLVEDGDASAWVPRRPRDAHKWQAAVWVVAGSPTMGGASALASSGALRAGGSYVRTSTPGTAVPTRAPIEAVAVPLPADGWHSVVLGDLDRIGSLVVGPGLGRAGSTAAEVRALVSAASVPVVVDGDALWAIADDQVGWPATRPTVLTPHDGEYRTLTGRAPGDDRIAAARELAAERHAVVLLKGPTTVVADAEGRVALVTTGDHRLATAGTGDVLAGVIGAFLARGAPPWEAAAAGAHVHGLAARHLPGVGAVASDLPIEIPSVLAASDGRAGADQ